MEKTSAKTYQLVLIFFGEAEKKWSKNGEKIMIFSKFFGFPTFDKITKPL